MPKRLIFNTIFNTASKLLIAAISFFIIPFLVNHLGQEKYGIWILLASIFFYRNTLSLGLNSSINRYIPIFLVKSDYQGINKVISLSFIYMLLVSFVLIFFTLVLFFNIQNWFSISDSLIDETLKLLLIIGVGFSIAMPFQIFSGVLSGLQRYDILALTEVISVVIRTVLLIIFLKNGYGLITLGVIFISAELFTRGFQFIYCLKSMPKINYSKFDIPFFWDMVKYGTNTLLYTLSSILICKSSDILIGVFFDASKITYYYISLATILMLSLFVESFSAAIKPAVSQMDAENNFTNIQKIALRSQKYVLAILLPVIIFLIIEGKSFLSVWMGTRFSDYTDSYHILVILAIGHFFRLNQYTSFIVLVGKGRHKAFGLLTFFMALCSVILSVVFLKIIKKDLISIAIANSISMLIFSGIILPLYFNKTLAISLKTKFIHVWKPVLMGLVPSLIFMSISRLIFNFNCPLYLSSYAIVLAILVLTGNWFLNFNKDERKIFKSIIGLNS